MWKFVVFARIIETAYFQGISTYDYILAMKEENQSMELESLEDSDFSSSDDESTDPDSPQKPAFMSRIICKDGKTQQVIHVDTFFFSFMQIHQHNSHDITTINIYKISEPTKVGHKDRWRTW